MSNLIPIVLGLGELLWDCYEDLRRPGGAPANVAFQAQQLGLQGVVCSRVGDDKLGKDLLTFLKNQGLSTNSIQIDMEHPTGTVTVETPHTDAPHYIIHQDVAWDYLYPSKDFLDLAHNACAICFGTLAQRSDCSRKTIHTLLDSASFSCMRVYDVNLRQKFYCRSWIEFSLKKANIVKLNESEVEMLSHLFERRMISHEEFATWIRKSFNVECVCITRANRGCLLVGAGSEPHDKWMVVDIPGKPVNVIDTVGAGDAFTAALIYARLQGWTLDVQGQFANEVGALVASRPGAMPIIKDELAELTASFRR